jgi:Protein of unknown function (DUF2637)
VSALIGWLTSWWSKIIAGTALAVVAGVTGVISYKHIYTLSIALYQPVMVARLMPFGVDGLIVVGSVVLMQATPDHPRLGWFGVVPGVAVSLFANVESGIAHGPLAAGWAGVPAGAFAVATFLLERWLKSQVSRGGPAGAHECPHGVASTAEEAVRLAFLHGRDCLGDVPSQRQLATAFGWSRPKVAGIVSALAP